MGQSVTAGAALVCRALRLVGTGFPREGRAEQASSRGAWHGRAVPALPVLPCRELGRSHPSTAGGSRGDIALGRRTPPRGGRPTATFPAAGGRWLAQPPGCGSQGSRARRPRERGLLRAGVWGLWQRRGWSQGSGNKASIPGAGARLWALRSRLGGRAVVLQRPNPARLRRGRMQRALRVLGRAGDAPAAPDQGTRGRSEPGAPCTRLVSALAAPQGARAVPAASVAQPPPRARGFCLPSLSQGAPPGPPVPAQPAEL